MSPFNEDTAGRMAAPMDAGSAATAGAILVGWLGVGAALSVIRTPQHFLTIAWREGDDEPKIEVVALQVPGREMKSLKAALAPLTVARK